MAIDNDPGPMEVSIVLDSGCFLPKAGDCQGKACSEIGYFAGDDNVPDIRVYVDGHESPLYPSLKFGRRIRVVHYDSDGNPKKEPIEAADTFNDDLLSFRDLYGYDLTVDPEKFACVIRFESGHFCPSMVKKRFFMQTERVEGKPGLEFKPTGIRKPVERPIAHDLVVIFRLEKGERLEVESDGSTLISTERLKPARRVDIEFPAENTTSHQFYCGSFTDDCAPAQYYWEPNCDDPPPICPRKPCP